MKRSLLLITLSTLFFFTGCATTTVPSDPKLHPEKYALQVLLIEVPVVDTEPTSAYAPAPKRNIEALLKNLNAIVTELPIVYAAIGETAINDQTETISAPKNYELKTDTNGVVRVIYSDDTKKVGQYVEMTLQKVENHRATCDLWFYNKSLQGMQKYNVAPATETQDAVTASMPIFRTQGMKTQVTLIPGNWISMGGLIGGTAKNAKNAVEKHTFVRILPPKGVPFNPTQPTPQVYRFPVSELEKTTP